MGKHVPEEFVLLCETCGYDIEGLPADGACPECGRPIRQSVAESRPGTPWQRRPSAGSLLLTWTATLLRPRTIFSQARPDGGHAGLFMLTMVAASLPILPLCLIAIWKSGIEYIPVRDGGFTVVTAEFTAMLVALCVAAATWVLLVLLSKIEERGIRFWGPRRGWRITPQIAKTICAHASVGWVVGSVLALAGHALGWVLLEITNRHNVGVFRGPMQLAPITLPALCLIAGMLTFEILVYVGMGRMKFANRSPLGQVPPPATGRVITREMPAAVPETARPAATVPSLRSSAAPPVTPAEHPP